MTTTIILFVLGAADPEMQAIESLLKECGIEYVYATAPDGQRVHPGNAYKCLHVERATHWVECSPAEGHTGVVVDHHRPGDPGYGKPPEEFFSASSLGQVVGIIQPMFVNYDRVYGRKVPTGTVKLMYIHGEPSWLVAAERTDRGGRVSGVTASGRSVTTEEQRDFADRKPDYYSRMTDGRHLSPDERREAESKPAACAAPAHLEWRHIPRELTLVAAADHCLAAAYRGECPGVDPDALMAWRIKSRSEFQRKSCKTCKGEGKVWDGTHGCSQWHDGEDDHADCYTSNQKFCPDCSEDAILKKVASARVALVDARSLILSPGIDDTCGRCEGCGVKCAGTEDDESWDYCECPAVRDMRGIKCPELPEASAREGVCFVADGLADRDGRVKVVCQSGTPEQIRAFMEWAPANGLIDIYGDPARGFAGGYLV